MPFADGGQLPTGSKRSISCGFIHLREQHANAEIARTVEPTEISAVPNCERVGAAG
jgi:hypothetical protein